MNENITPLYITQSKSIAVAYVLWFFIGMLGAHRFYLDRFGSALTILLTTLVGMVAPIILLIPAIWNLVDLFLIPSMTKEYNLKLLEQLEDTYYKVG